jgi:uncharacterized protein (TIGR02300 family)
MATASLGSKCTCVGCGARFYDLTRTPAVCPRCGAAQPVVPVVRRREPVARAPARRFERAPVMAAAEDEAPETELPDEDEENDAELDTDEVDDVVEIEDDAPAT